jgi:uncharacterized protein (DUF1800 family)
MMGDSLDQPMFATEDFGTAVNNVIVKSVDQLRQRMAWSLQNIVVASGEVFGTSSSPDGLLSFYDIFVENAFGNYYDVLKRVSYHLLMGQWLSYHGNSAYAYSRTVRSFEILSFSERLIDVLSSLFCSIRTKTMPERSCSCLVSVCTSATTTGSSN